MVKQHLGYSVFGYFLFFDEEGAGELLNENVSFFILIGMEKGWDVLKDGVREVLIWNRSIAH